MIPFNVTPYIGKEDSYVMEAIHSRRISGDGAFTKRCHYELETLTGSKKALLTTSGTSALELAAILSDVRQGDEVIMPSYTFSSTANAFALRGAEIVFVDVEPGTMNVDPSCIAKAVTKKTKVIVPMHYAGVCCDMDSILQIADDAGAFVIEDAAQAVDAYYNGRAAGTMSDVGCFSFHESKNFSMGEGGAALLQDDKLIERAEIVREKGTDRSKFFLGLVDKYTWVDIGSSILPSELNAAYLLPQLEDHDTITDFRLARWNQYYDGLSKLADIGKVNLPYVPDKCRHNAHMFFIKCQDETERAALIAHLKECSIGSVFHYIPLHSAKAGYKFGHFHGEDRYTTIESERLLRLPMYYGLSQEDCEYVIQSVYDFYEEKA